MNRLNLSQESVNLAKQELQQMRHGGPFYNWVEAVCLRWLPEAFSADITSTSVALGGVRNLHLSMLKRDVHFFNSGWGAR